MKKILDKNGRWVLENHLQPAVHKDLLKAERELKKSLAELKEYLDECFYLCKYIPKEMRFSEKGSNARIKEVNRNYLKQTFKVEWEVFLFPLRTC